MSIMLSEVMMVCYIDSHLLVTRITNVAMRIVIQYFLGVSCAWM